MSFGPNPWQQLHWDARAAGNFMGGGAGTGLLIAAVAFGAAGGLRMTAIGLAIALVGAGLLCVWAEIGRPWRALNVFINPRTSWMSREAAVAPLLMGSAVLAFFGIDTVAWVAAALALVFLYCQARILRAARGIPAWREPLTVPLIVVSGLSEGTGLYAALAVLWGWPSVLAGLALVVSLGLRTALGIAWRRRVARALRGPAARSLVHCRLASRLAGPLPLGLVLAALLLPLPAAWAGALQAVAGVLALAGGAWFKYALITRMAFNQGFALPHLPVRGVPRG